jgi:hypothetical protein
MPTVLDSFTIELGLDPRQFTEGERDAMAAFKKTQEAALAYGKDVEMHAGRLADLFSVAKAGAIGLVGAFAGGEIAGFINNVANMDATTGRLAHSLGQSTENLSKWEGMVRMVGGSAGDAQRVFAGVTDAINNYMATTGLPPPALISLFNRTGVGMNQFMQNPNAAWDKISAFASGENQRQPGMGRWWLQQIPGMTEAFMNLLLQGPERMRQMREEISRLGFATEMSADEMIDFQAKSAGLNVALENLARRTFPALIFLTNELAKAVDGISAMFGNNDKNVANLKKGELGKALWGDDMWNYIHQPGANFSGVWDLLRGRKPGGAAGTPGAGGTLGANERNFLAGLSFLETDHRNVGNASSSAQGFFQFLSGTAQKATGAGLPDPRAGTWAQQADATMQFIKKFYPQAADAIDKGDFVTATMILRGEWPSLPGGAQSQSRSRYETWADVVHGSGPRPPGEGGSFEDRWGGIAPGAGAAARGQINNSTQTNQHQSSTDISIGDVTIVTQAKDSDGIFRDAASGLRKNLAAAMNYNNSMTG